MWIPPSGLDFLPQHVLSSLNTPVTQRQPTRQRTTNATEINKQSLGSKYLSGGKLATDKLQVVPRQVFTPNSRLLISAAFVVLSRVGCFGVTGVLNDCYVFI